MPRRERGSVNDRETLSVYDARAAEYAESFGKDHAADPSLRAFIDALPDGAKVLDLGCGPGTWAAAMLADGLEVDAVDASAGMVAQARRVPGLQVRQASFDEIDAVHVYDGIWANFSLLHAPRDDMPGHLAGLHLALKPGGLMHIGLKTGRGAARDGLGRFYTYYTVTEMTGLLEALGLSVGDLREGADKGLDGVVAGWFTLTARKPQQE
nr:class I SAM-dependent methyltransferase [Sagittula marina]